MKSETDQNNWHLINDGVDAWLNSELFHSMQSRWGTVPDFIQSKDVQRTEVNLLAGIAEIEPCWRAVIYRDLIHFKPVSVSVDDCLDVMIRDGVPIRNTTEPDRVSARADVARFLRLLETLNLITGIRDGSHRVDRNWDDAIIDGSSNIDIMLTTHQCWRCGKRFTFWSAPNATEWGFSLRKEIESNPVVVDHVVSRIDELGASPAAVLKVGQMRNAPTEGVHFHCPCCDSVQGGTYLLGTLSDGMSSIGSMQTSLFRLDSSVEITGSPRIRESSRLGDH